MHVLAVVREVGTLPTIEAAAVDHQRLGSVVHRRPLDQLLVEIKLGHALGDPVEQLQAIVALEMHHVNGDPTDNAIANTVPLCRDWHRSPEMHPDRRPSDRRALRR